MELYITYNEISCRYPTTNLSILTTSLCVHSDFCSNANGGELKIARVLVLKLKLNYPNKDTRNCQEKGKKIIHLKPNQLAPSIYIMKELCFLSLDQ